MSSWKLLDPATYVGDICVTTGHLIWRQYLLRIFLSLKLNQRYQLHQQHHNYWRWQRIQCPVHKSGFNCPARYFACECMTIAVVWLFQHYMLLTLIVILWQQTADVSRHRNFVKIFLAACGPLIGFSAHSNKPGVWKKKKQQHSSDQISSYKRLRVIWSNLHHLCIVISANVLLQFQENI